MKRAGKELLVTRVWGTVFRTMLVLGLAVRCATAQSVTAPWKNADIGAPVLSGGASQTSGVFSIDAAGEDIWNTNDQFHFVYQQIAGDVEVTARVRGLTATHPWAKAGVMIRATPQGNSAHASALVSAANGVHFQRRTATGAQSASTGAGAATASAWVRAVRTGTQVTTFWSPDGSTWTRIGSVTLPLASSAYVGIAVTSHDPGTRTTGTVSDVTVKRMGFPTGQLNTDIGAPAIAGNATYSSGAYSITAGGTDIWGTADQFHFVYQPLTGNGEIVARIASLDYTHSWAKAGVMFREALTPESRHASVFTSASKGYAFQRRPETGGLSAHTSGGSGAPPGWVRLVRTGDLFQAYRSADGVSWTAIGSDTIPMASTVYVGLAVTSHSTTTATTAVVDGVTITGGASANGAPAVSVTAPFTGARYVLPATITLTATATDPEGRLASVDFYVGSTLISRDSSAPYSASWSPSSAGTYSLTAVAHDADGGSTTSGAVSVTVRAANSPPSIALTSPASAASFAAPATVSMTATATDPEGQVARVEFLNGTTVVGSDTSAPYGFSWSNVPAGTYTLRAVAYDADEASATSAAITISVTATSTPPRLVQFAASTDHATQVTSYLFEVFASGANPATATPVATSDLGKPTPTANNEITVDRSGLFSALTPGTYVATVTAIGSGGRSRSAAVTFTR